MHMKVCCFSLFGCNLKYKLNGIHLINNFIKLKYLNCGCLIDFGDF